MQKLDTFRNETGMHALHGFVGLDVRRKHWREKVVEQYIVWLAGIKCLKRYASEMLDRKRKRGEHRKVLCQQLWEDFYLEMEGIYWL